jgi:ribosomal protein S1
VRVRIIRIESERRRIGLSLKGLGGPKPVMEAEGEEEEAGYEVEESAE